MKKSEPWYIHAGLWVVIVILTYILIQVAIVQPREIMKMERYYTKESRLRMDNIRQAEILWQKQKKYYTDNLDSLIQFIKNDSTVQALVNGYDTAYIHKKVKKVIDGKDTMVVVDSMVLKPKNPFKPLLSVGKFVPESLFYAPKSHRFYHLEVDTNIEYDTTVNRWGKLVRIDTIMIFGNRYYLEDPDGYGSIGDVYNDALKNTASWE